MLIKRKSEVRSRKSECESWSRHAARRRRLLALCFTLSFGCACFGQAWEVGGAATFGTYRNLTVSNATSSAQAGLTNGVGFGAVLGQRLYRHFGGEARYLYQSGDLRLKGSGQEPKLGAESHTLSYDLLVHATRPEAPVRPFVAAGAGVKIYRGTGVEPVYQPLNTLAVLTRTREMKPLVSVGGGVKFAMGSHALFRVDFRDYTTPVPEKLFATRSGSSLSGWFHDFVFLVGVSYTFHEKAY